MTLLIRDVKNSLQSSFDESNLSLVQKGCLNWLNESATVDYVDGRRVADEVEADYTALSYIGYGSQFSSDPQLITALSVGCQRLIGRSIRRTTGELQSFALDPVALFGIALGASLVEKSLRFEVSKLLVEALEASSRSFVEDSLKSAFAVASFQYLNVSPPTWLAPSPSTALAILTRLGSAIPDSLVEPAYVEVKALAFDVKESFVAGVSLFALNSILNQGTELSLGKPTVEQIFTVLNGVQAGMMRWPYGQNKTQLWNIENEYDVQAMLYFLLKPYLPELKEEEPLPSIGRKRPRVDLVVPSLRLSIEVKFIRKSGNFNDILGEVAEDKSLYLGSGSKYAHMIVVLWDDLARIEEHASFKQGVTELELDGAVVISRPSFMIRQPTA